MSAFMSPSQSVGSVTLRQSGVVDIAVGKPGEIGREVERVEGERAGDVELRREPRSSARPEALLPSSVNSAFSTESPLLSNAAVPKPLAGPSVEPGPIGLPSQEAKRRSEGVESFSAPASFGSRIVVAPRR